MEYPMNHQVQSILENAHKEAKEMGNNYIGSEHLLLSIIFSNLFTNFLGSSAITIIGLLASGISLSVNDNKCLLLVKLFDVVS